jgi:hypothetical protein
MQIVDDWYGNAHKYRTKFTRFRKAYKASTGAWIAGTERMRALVVIAGTNDRGNINSLIKTS